MADRRRQIQQLLATRYDGLWFPGGALRTDSGLVPTKRVACPDCGSSETPGWRVDSFKRRTPCVTCGGKPGERPKGGKGVVAVDPMDSQRQVIGSSDTAASSRPRRRVKCDACQDIDGTPTGVVKGERCTVCGGDGWRDLHRFDLALDVREDVDVDALTASIARRDAAGSYHELDLALAGISRVVNKPLIYLALTVNATEARRLLDDLYLTRARDERSLTQFERALVDLALLYLDSRMPDPIRVPADVIANDRLRRDAAKAKGQALNDHQRKARDQQIRQWAREGRPYSWIRSQVGLSDRQVREIINGRERSVA
jgi:hypothetical protein